MAAWRMAELRHHSRPMDRAGPRVRGLLSKTLLLASYSSELTECPIQKWGPFCTAEQKTPDVTLGHRTKSKLCVEKNNPGYSPCAPMRICQLDCN